MSTTVDERVVEMRFDNKQFEQNIQTSLSSLDKLKKAIRSALGKRMEMAVLVLPYRTGIRTTEVIP